MGAVAPFIAPAIGLFGAINQRNSQKAANAASQANQQSQGAVLQEAVQLAQQLSGENYTQPIRDAGSSAIKTFQADAGGVPNIGLLASSLFGDNLGNAMKAAAAQRSSNLEGAISALTGTGQQYNQRSVQAGQAAQAQGNPYSNIMSLLPGLIPGMGGGGQTNVATGPGGTGSGGGLGDSYAYGYGDPNAG